MDLFCFRVLKLFVKKNKILLSYVHTNVFIKKYIFKSQNSSHTDFLKDVEELILLITLHYNPY